MADASIRSVLLSQEEVPAGAWGRGSRNVIEAWNGAAYDGERYAYFMGGGYHAYGGNEVYRLDLAELRWERLTEPTPLLPPDGKACPGLQDPAAPAAGHSFDGIIHDGATGSLFLWGQDRYCRKNWGGGRSALFRFDIANRRWEDLGPPDGEGMAKTAPGLQPGRFIVAFKHKIGEFDARTGQLVRTKETPRGLPDGQLAAAEGSTELLLLDGGITMGDARTLELQRVRQDAPFSHRAGAAYHPDTERFVIWNGGRLVWTVAFDPGGGDAAIHEFANAEGPAPGRSASRGVYSKWFYYAPADVFVGYDNPFQGVWLYKLPEEAGREVLPARLSGTGEAAEDGVLTVCRQRAAGCEYGSFAAAVRDADAGQTVELRPGIYRECTAVTKPLTIRAQAGATLRRRVCGGKAAIIQRADLTVTGLECSHMAGRQGNEACIRLEQGDLTLRDVYFHHSHNGILGGGEGASVTIENSRFEQNGHGGRAHGLYLSHRVHTLTFRNNQVLASKGEGHGLKSRAKVNIIENNVIAGLDGNSSREIDLPNGGRNVIRGNVLQKGPAAANNDLICVGCELKAGSGRGADARHETLIEDNLVLCDSGGEGGCTLVHDLTAAVGGSTTVRGNRIVGPVRIGKPENADVERVDNATHPNREAARVPAFPALPKRADAAGGG